MKKNQGFTLIEVLAVITILAILTAISTVAVNNIRKNQNLKNKENIISSIFTGAKEYYAKTKIFPSEGVNVYDLLIDDYISLDESKYYDLLYISGENANIENGVCTNCIKVKSEVCGLKIRYYLDKTFTDKNTTFKYEDCGCEVQPETVNAKSNTLCKINQ